MKSQIVVIDSDGNKIVATRPVKRIITLAPNLTEILCAVGAENQLVGRDKNSDYPLEVQNVPVVGDYYKINIEKVLKLQPDLIVFESTPHLPSQITLLKKKNVLVYINRAKTLNSISKTMMDLGKLSCHEETAKLKSKLFVQGLKSHPVPTKKLTVFYELWHTPLLTVTEKTIIGQTITLCGGQNIAASFKFDTPKVSYETVLRANPDIIITSVKNSDWQRFTRLKAVKNHKVFYLSPDLVERTGPRLLLGKNRICQFVNPKPLTTFQQKNTLQ